MREVSVYINNRTVTVKVVNKSSSSLEWLLSTGYWNDQGVWVDNETWND